jgi:FlaA1/EpsC-like NDP-sugar epimerase
MNALLENIVTPTRLKRTLLFAVLDCFCIFLSLILSFLLRFEFLIPPKFSVSLYKALLLFLVVKLAVFALFKLYSMTWRYVGVNDIWNIFSATVIAELLLVILVMIPLSQNYEILSSITISPFPRSVFIFDAVLTFSLVSVVRGSKRFYLEIVKKSKFRSQGKRTIIVGAGDTGDMVIRDILRQEFPEFYPVAFLDDNQLKKGSYLHGVRVEGEVPGIKASVKRHQAEAVIIAIPNLDHKALKAIYTLSRESGVQTVKIVPRIYDVHQPAINLKNLEDIRIEDLIGRQLVVVDNDAITAFLADKVVLITGAGGSIGSELTIQAAGNEPSRLVLLDADETDLHNLELRLKTAFPGAPPSSRITDDKLLPQELYLPNGCIVSFVVADIRERALVDQIFSAVRPDVIFHAAAYKHVPMMEYNAQEAVKVNLFGTRNLADAASRYGTKKFIMISTDKAVRPTSVMGATKRLAEYICKTYNNELKTEFVSVRFGNVLGSRGSVLPTFLEQLRHGGPLTVTHPDMVRYFMTIPEAVSLVLQASVLGRGGEVMVLDMGEPVKIVNLAEDLIRIHGLEPGRDVDIVYSGVRPGEKLFEEMLTAEEGTLASKHAKIFVARDNELYTKTELENILKEFDVLADAGIQSNHDGSIRKALKKYVKHYDVKG